VPLIIDGPLDDTDILILRTDFSNPTGWQAILSGVEAEDPDPYQFIDDTQFDGVQVEQVRALLGERDDVYMVYLADDHAMRDSEHALLAVNMPDGGDGDEDAAEVPIEFRVLPGAVFGLQVDVGSGNTLLEEYLNRLDANGVLR
jgi:hypothetical protein